ncbi:MAG TPA: hypothetical protein DDW76_31435 [Cyanobacteria bacterium UBA11369]|nr:hypothetical protein [Cyanobacteria bacterium UBA11371]HBE31526.1 hypothetical protein [Cyanobacteria bacterium UBA11368]HBE53154.1 hypothetical protein [Cyanobacteria bacterium UBA11369]
MGVQQIRWCFANFSFPINWRQASVEIEHPKFLADCSRIRYTESLSSGSVNASRTQLQAYWLYLTHLQSAVYSLLFVQ